MATPNPPEIPNWLHGLIVEIATGVTTAIISAGATALYYKYKFDALLTGHWHGKLTCEGPGNEQFKNDVINCVLVIARPESGQMTGLFHYCRQCTVTDKILVQGLDEFQDYERKDGSDFKMDFTRVFHKRKKCVPDRSKTLYTFDCHLDGKLNQQLKLNIETAFSENGRQYMWKGIFSKK